MEGKKILERRHLKADRFREQGNTVTEAVFKDDGSDSSVTGSGKAASKDPEISSGAAPITSLCKDNGLHQRSDSKWEERINAF